MGCQGAVWNLSRAFLGLSGPSNGLLVVCQGHFKLISGSFKGRFGSLSGTFYDPFRSFLGAF